MRSDRMTHKSFLPVSCGLSAVRFLPHPCTDGDGRAAEVSRVGQVAGWPVSLQEGQRVPANQN